MAKKLFHRSLSAMHPTQKATLDKEAKDHMARMSAHRMGRTLKDFSAEELARIQAKVELWIGTRQCRVTMAKEPRRIEVE